MVDTTRRMTASERVCCLSRREGTACGGFTNQLDVIDISNKTSPLLISSYAMYNPSGLGIDGDLIFICDGEAGLKIILSRHFALTGGYRIWWNRTYAGTWESHPVGASSTQVPLKEFQTIRHGALVGLTGSF